MFVEIIVQIVHVLDVYVAVCMQRSTTWLLPFIEMEKKMLKFTANTKYYKHIEIHVFILLKSVILSSFEDPLHVHMFEYKNFHPW